MLVLPELNQSAEVELEELLLSSARPSVISNDSMPCWENSREPHLGQGTDPDDILKTEKSRADLLQKECHNEMDSEPKKKFTLRP
jgi:hypothetical protein